MSEYWVSKKKYFCKYCETYIADDVPSRQHHENGLRHKGNRERFIRGLYKEGEKRKKDLDEERREMARVEMAAQAAYSQDIGAGLAKASSSSDASSSKKELSHKIPTRPSNPFENYSTAASLGYTDPDADLAAAESARRRTEGVAGGWKVVEVAPPSTEEISPEGLREGETLKRPAEEDLDDARTFKIRKKTLRTGLGEIYDPGVIKLKLKKQDVEQEIESEDVDPNAQVLTTGTLSLVGGGERPKWSAVKWKRAGGKSPSIKKEVQTSLVTTADGHVARPGHLNSDSFDVEVSNPNDGAHVISKPPVEHDISVKIEPEETKTSLLPSTVAEPAPSMFRRRKVATGSGSRVKREVL
ncbi:hypothetical protein D9757_004272 [Collybiopsis confluens]|uniref:Matrin-type domain-containing protein n=1 Tax=Collybiopsis confluens TaxID=2823264 RepID=A0A8H5MDA3_9AGAR|nr:hypothetical protein D9757_004272 [Collybiopsis confluens]